MRITRIKPAALAVVVTLAAPAAVSAATSTPVSPPEPWSVRPLETFSPAFKLGVMGVNTGGTVVGLAQDFGFTTYPLVWDASGAVSLLPGVGGQPDSRGWAVGGINDAGQIAGGIENVDRPDAPFNETRAHAVWEPDADGQYTAADVRLAPLVGADYGTRVWWGLEAINDHGLTAHAGGRRTADGGWGGYGGFRWQAGDPLLGDPLLAPGGATNASFYVASLNNAGTVVGGGNTGPLLWEEGQVQATALPAKDAPLATQVPAAIDDGGMVVGQYRPANDPTPRPLAWGPDGALLDLVGTGGETGDALLGTAADVDEGVAVGWQEDADGNPRGVIWLDPLGGAPAVHLDDLLGDAADGWEFDTASALAVGRSGAFDVLRVVAHGRHPDFNDGFPAPVLLTRRAPAPATPRGVDRGVAFGPGASWAFAASAVPEPGVAGLLGLSGGLVLRWRQRPCTAGPRRGRVAA